MSKTVEMIEQAVGFKKQMVVLARTSPDVQRYLRLQGKREKVHRLLAKHVKRYNMDTDKYKKYGMIAQNRSTVRTTDVHDLAKAIGGETGKRIFKLIRKNLVVFTK